MSEAVSHNSTHKTSTYDPILCPLLFSRLPSRVPGIFGSKIHETSIFGGSNVYRLPREFGKIFIHCLFLPGNSADPKKIDWFHVQHVLKKILRVGAFTVPKIYFCFSPMDWKGLKRAPKWKVYILLSYYSFVCDFYGFHHESSCFPNVKGNSYFFQTPFPSKSKLEIQPFFTGKTHMDLSRTFGS